jgi:hypothetical protein
MPLLDKEPAISLLVEKLVARFGQTSLAVADHWPSDRSAVGFVRPGTMQPLVYVSTFGAASGRYFACLERASLPEDEVPYTPVGECEGLDFEALAQVIAQHLALR